jgi:hypothetical protein
MALAPRLIEKDTRKKSRSKAAETRAAAAAKKSRGLAAATWEEPENSKLISDGA